MKVLDQLQRIEKYTTGEEPPTVRLKLRFGGRNVDDVLGKTRQVLKLVAATQSQEWPRDDDWRRQLPGWFLASFEGRSLEEIIADPELWDFGSWLDAMKNPGWEWWSCLVDGPTAMVRVSAYSDPYSIDPLIYLLRTAGAAAIEFEEE